MAAGGAADDADVFGVEVQTISVGSEPTDGGFAIVEILRPARLVGFWIVEEVVDAEADVAVRGERGADVDFAVGVALAAGPAAAVDDDDAGYFFPFSNF